MNPPVLAPKSAQFKPVTSRENASSAAASLSPPRETNGHVLLATLCSLGIGMGCDQPSNSEKGDSCLTWRRIGTLQG